jgi:hypothetical protein
MRQQKQLELLLLAQARLTLPCSSVDQQQLAA